jgi:hypothetical protein
MAQLQKAPQGMWYYKDEEDKDKGKLVRRFTDLVALGCNDTEYSLCTEEEKQEWINSHKEDYPEIFNQENNNENGV